MTPRHRFTLGLLRFTPVLLSITEHYRAICWMSVKRSTDVLSDHVATSQCPTRGNVTPDHVPTLCGKPTLFCTITFSNHEYHEFLTSSSRPDLPCPLWMGVVCMMFWVCCVHCNGCARYTALGVLCVSHWVQFVQCFGCYVYRVCFVHCNGCSRYNPLGVLSVSPSHINMIIVLCILI